MGTQGAVAIGERDTKTRRLDAETHICLVDYGNYPFAFDLVTHWPRHLGFISYIFGNDQLHRNTAVANTTSAHFGGEICGIGKHACALPPNLIGRYRHDVMLAKSSVHQLNKLNPHIVIGANNPLDLQSEVAEWCHRRQKPFVFWLQDLRGVAAKTILEKRLRTLGTFVGSHYCRLENRLLRKSSHVISIADEFRSHVLSAGLEESQLSTIPNWAPLKALPMRHKDNHWTRSKGLSGRRVALYTGNLGMKHNPAHLIALSEALRSQPDVAVVVVAEGLAVRWLSEQARERRLDNLIIEQFVGAAVLPDLLGAADIYIGLLEPDASRYSVPSKIWTYLCGGKPLVLSICKNNQAAAMVERIGVGVTSEPMNKTQFVRNCIEMLNRPLEERQAIGARGRSFAEEHFDMELIVARISRCLESALLAKEQNRRR